MEDIEKLNTGVTGWARSSLGQVKKAYVSAVRSPGRSGDGLDSLKIRTGKSFGAIDRISFGFNRYLVWVMKGAGKGQGGQKGSSWINKSGIRKKTKGSSLGKMATGRRKENDFMNPVFDDQIPKLADIVAGFKADQVIKTIQIK